MTNEETGVSQMTTLLKSTLAYRVPAELRSNDSTVTLPIEIHSVSDGNWYAVYDGADDVEYPDLYELARDHGLDIDHETLAGWANYCYQRELVVCD